MYPASTFWNNRHPLLHTLNLRPAIFAHALCHINIGIAFGAFDHMDSGIQGHDAVIMPKGEGIFLIPGCYFPLPQVHQSDLQLHVYAQRAVFLVFLQIGIVNNVVINDIRPGIVASAGFVVQVIIESLFINAGTVPEFLLSSVLFLLVASDGPQYHVSIAQVEKVIENHGQDRTVNKDFPHIVAVERSGGIHDPYKAQQ